MKRALIIATITSVLCMTIFYSLLYFAVSLNVAQSILYSLLMGLFIFGARLISVLMVGTPEKRKLDTEALDALKYSNAHPNDTKAIDHAIALLYGLYGVKEFQDRNGKK